MEPQRCGQCVELRGGEGAQRHERGVGVEPGAYRTHLGDAPGEALGKQADNDRQDVMDQPDPALDPAHRARELDRVGAQRIARRAQARGLLGVRHHLFDLIEGARNPRFLILHWIHIPNLGSHILALIRRRLPEDWTERYNTTPVLIETFVETPRYTGAVYRASGWLHVGTTQGRGRYDRDKRYDKPKKDVWLRPLRKDWKRTLNR